MFCFGTKCSTKTTKMGGYDIYDGRYINGSRFYIEYILLMVQKSHSHRLDVWYKKTLRFFPGIKTT